MATFEPPSAEKLFFSDKTFACLIDCTPKHIGGFPTYSLQCRVCIHLTYTIGNTFGNTLEIYLEIHFKILFEIHLNIHLEINLEINL